MTDATTARWGRRDLLRRVTAEPEGRGRLRPYLISVLLVTGTTALAASARAVFPVPDLEMLYLLAVVLT
ncbi:MAG: DUF4118 domain-containing protein, partial [Polyangiaceae bacterium]|nr:DUF4118 domain-containing protein [Polyangiaceae bacterium]